MKLEDVRWPAEELATALEVVGDGAPSATSGTSPASVRPSTFTDAGAARAWIGAIAEQADLEAQDESISYRDFRNAIARAAPIALRIPDSSQPEFIVVTGAHGRSAVAVDRHFHHVELNCDNLRDYLFRERCSAVLPKIDQLLRYAAVSERRRAHARQVLLEEMLASSQIADCWALRRRAGAGIWRHARDARLPSRAGLMLGSFAGAYVLYVLAWWVLGRSALQGRFDRGWIAAWSLLLLTIIPLRLFTTWMQGVTAAGAGWIFRKKLLYGILRLDPDEMRSFGIGHFLGRALELEAIESLGFSGGIMGIIAVIELTSGAVVLGLGAAPFLELLTLAVWVTLICGLLLDYLRRRREWAGVRLRMSHDLVERMVGHRTRIIQERPERWHTGEDEILSTYLDGSRQMDRIFSLVNAVTDRGLVLISLLALAPLLIRGNVGASSIAITLGGILIANEGIRKIVNSVTQLADAIIAWDRVRPVLAASTHPAAMTGAVDGLPVRAKGPALAHKLVELKDVRFQHRGRPEPILQRCNLSICLGDRWLLEGPSGSGKSTLISILAGLRPPASGLLSLNGLDLQTIGADSWRRRVATAPQFHENHVFTETFAFNLLMGRQWPPTVRDIQEAEALCRELGLTELLSHMPAGLFQMVGETGWQLSHGERSRLFIARAVLQNADVIILDESFAALDPESLRRCVECVLSRASTLLVVTHH